MFVLTDSQKVSVRLAPRTAAGNPANVDADEPVVWSSSDSSVMTVTPDAVDPLMAVVEAVGPVGTAQLSVSADADLGDGLRTLSALDEIQVVAGEAAVLGIEFGSAVEK